eukprot:9442052-Pyramimonas_sp.AAC.1
MPLLITSETGSPDIFWYLARSSSNLLMLTTTSSRASDFAPASLAHINSALPASLGSHSF